MPRVCSVCTHPERDQIDKAIVSGSGVSTAAPSLRRIAQRFGLVETSVRRHRRHVGLAVGSAKPVPPKTEKGERERGLTLVQRVKGLDAQLVQAARLAKKQRDAKGIVAAVRGRRELIETEAKLELLANPSGGPFGQQPESADEFGLVRVRGRADLLTDYTPEETGRPRRVGRTIDVSPTVVDERPALPPGEVDPEPSEAETEFKRRLAALDGRIASDDEDEDEPIDELETDMRGRVIVPDSSTVTVVGGGR
jgi:hypothetical protein